MEYKYIKISYDSEVQASMIPLNTGKIARTIEVTDQCFIDVSSDDKILGIELLGPSTILDGAEFPSIAIDFTSRTSTFRKNAVESGVNFVSVGNLYTNAI